MNRKLHSKFTNKYNFRKCKCQIYNTAHSQICVNILYIMIIEFGVQNICLNKKNMIFEFWRWWLLCIYLYNNELDLMSRKHTSCIGICKCFTT